MRRSPEFEEDQKMTAIEVEFQRFEKNEDNKFLELFCGLHPDSDLAMLSNLAEQWGSKAVIGLLHVSGIYPKPETVAEIMEALRKRSQRR